MNKTTATTEKVKKNTRRYSNFDELVPVINQLLPEYATCEARYKNIFFEVIRVTFLTSCFCLPNMRGLASLGRTLDHVSHVLTNAGPDWELRPLSHSYLKKQMASNYGYFSMEWFTRVYLTCQKYVELNSDDSWSANCRSAMRILEAGIITSLVQPRAEFEERVGLLDMNREELSKWIIADEPLFLEAGYTRMHHAKLLDSILQERFVPPGAGRSKQNKGETDHRSPRISFWLAQRCTDRIEMLWREKKLAEEPRTFDDLFTLRASKKPMPAALPVDQGNLARFRDERTAAVVTTGIGTPDR